MPKLTPLPLFVRPVYGCPYEVVHPGKHGNEGVANFSKKEDAEFFIKARRFFDIMTRRPRWELFAASPTSFMVSWKDADTEHRFGNKTGNSFPDPFTAVDEADKWWAKNIDTPSLELKGETNDG